MRPSELWRTTTFRLTLIYGVVFALGVVALLGMVYLQSAVYLTRRVDGILNTEADSLMRSPPAQLGQRIDEALALGNGQTSVFALFRADGSRVTGNLPTLPAMLKPGGRPIEIAPTAVFPTHARLLARALPSGGELVVGRDVNQLREMREIIASALVWSGVVIIIAGLGCGVVLSVRPLRRLRGLQGAGEEIARGNLKRRMPVSGAHDELDMFAATVNYMMGEVERLMQEVRGSTETIAHDLRTPLTRARAQLHRIQQARESDPEAIARVIAEIDEVLERFRAVLRISELEARERHAGFTKVELADFAKRVIDLYQPLAEADGVRLTCEVAPGLVIDADEKLMFEAVSNLIDNGIKFTGAGGAVQLRVERRAGRPCIIVQDNGPGVPESERQAVLQRFFRSEHNRLVSGSGLGLSIVAAIVRLHGFDLSLQDAGPGLKAVIDCRERAVTY